MATDVLNLKMTCSKNVNYEWMASCETKATQTKWVYSNHPHIFNKISNCTEKPCYIKDFIVQKFVTWRFHCLHIVKYEAHPTNMGFLWHYTTEYTGIHCIPPTTLPISLKTFIQLYVIIWYTFKCHEMHNSY